MALFVCSTRVQFYSYMNDTYVRHWKYWAAQRLRLLHIYTIFFFIFFLAYSCIHIVSCHHQTQVWSSYTSVYMAHCTTSTTIGSIKLLMCKRYECRNSHINRNIYICIDLFGLQLDEIFFMNVERISCEHMVKRR